MGKREMNKIAIIVLGLFLFSCVSGTWTAAKEKTGKKKRVKYVKSKNGLKSLMTFAKDRGSMVQEYKEETENYRKVRTALDRGMLKHGESASRIKRKYGEPVIMLPEENGKFVKWIYKPGDKTFFSERKVYLIFDENDKLLGWHSLRPAEQN